MWSHARSAEALPAWPRVDRPDRTAAAERRLLKELAGRIKRQRLAAGITQEAAAARAGIDYKRYQRLEAGAVNATMRTLLRVAEAIGADVWEMIGRK